MKQLYLSGNTYEDISIKYNVDAKTVWNIVNNRTTHFRGE
jgi:Mor family transcriptional regulator